MTSYPDPWKSPSNPVHLEALKRATPAEKLEAEVAHRGLHGQWKKVAAGA
jgi:hypothetical protein